jgi:hypothetical protein
LASIDFCISSMFLVSASMDALRSSPMSSAEQEAADDKVGDAAAAEGGRASVVGGGAGWAAAEDEADRRDLDTKLSSALALNDGGPRLCSS